MGWTDRWDERAAYRALEKTGSLALSARPLETLSGGEYQRVMIAGALAQGAGILLLDEPTAFLDPKCRAEVHRLMTELHDEGFTLLWVTHDLCSALRYGHKILGLRDGRVAYYGSTRVFLENGMPESLFDVPFQVVTDPSTDRPLVIQEVLP